MGTNLKLSVPKSKPWVSYLIAFLVTSPIGLLSYYLSLFIKTPKPATVQVSPAIWWVGSVYPGQKPTKTFLLKNLSDRTLRIILVEKGCCTDVQLDRQVIPPHQTVQAHVVVKTAGLLGRLQLSSFLGFQGYKLPLRLNIIGNVMQPLPSEADFGTLRPGTTKTLLIQILSSYQPHLRVLQARYSPKFFHIVSIQPAAAGLLVTLKSNPNLPTGAFQQRVIFITNDPVQPRMETLVKGEMLPPLLVSPNPISLGVFHRLSSLQAVVVLKTSTHTLFTVSKVFVQPEGLFQVVESSHGRSIKQTVKLFLIARTLEEGPLAAKLFIFTDPPLPTNPVVVPIYGFYRAA